MRLIEGQTFRAPENRPYSYELRDPTEDLEFRRCRFAMFQHPAQRTILSRPTLRRVKLTRCHFDYSDLGPVILDECEVDTVWFHRGIWGAQYVGSSAFRHVTVRGNVTGSLKLGWTPPIGLQSYKDALAHPSTAANRAFYRRGDWALDISEARFTSFDMWTSDIPARLVKRDPETQAVLLREKLLDDRWAELDLPERAIGVGIEMFLGTGLPDTIVVASKRGRHFEAERQTIELLRAEGIAEHD